MSLDQPTIVPNLSGSRPVDKVAGSLISWIGGGVQPANRSKVGMFDDSAPIWKFENALNTDDDPERAHGAVEGLFLAEVFPAIALALWEPDFCQRLAAPKYNPAVRKKFQHAAWTAVVGVLARIALQHGVSHADVWCATMLENEFPQKADQDKVDAFICVLVGLHWLFAPRDQSIMIGDLVSGYMIAPSPERIHKKLAAAAHLRSVPIA